MNYEQIRAAVAKAVAAALPTSPDDNDCVVRFAEVDPENTPGVWSPIWGHPTEVIEAITTGVMQVLFPGAIWPPAQDPVTLPEELANHRILTSARWKCGCTTTECKLRQDVFRDSGTDPTAVLRVTCLTHGIRGDSEPARLADNLGTRQRAQAMYRLDLAHEEQCR